MRVTAISLACQVSALSARAPEKRLQPPEPLMRPGLKTSVAYVLSPGPRPSMSQASQAVPTSGFSGTTNGGDWQPARASTARSEKTRMPYYSPPSGIEFCGGFPQRLVRLPPKGRAADFLRGARRPPEVLACLF